MAKRIGVIDCETDPFKEGRIPAPFIWGFYSNEHGQLYFDTTLELVDFIAALDNYRVYGHYAGKFDFHFMLFAIPNWEKIIMINGRIAQFYISDTELCDSYCIIPAPLSAYQKTKIDYALFEPDVRHLHMPEIKAYLADDCLFLFELVNAFIDEHGYSLTIASAAIKKLQKIEGIKIEELGRPHYEAMLPYYYGGRVQCFQKGIIEGDITYLDINSAYPYAMKHKHPWGSFFKTRQLNPEIQGHNFYTFTAKSKGAFPWRNEEGALQFPADGLTREFSVTGWEVMAAIDLGLAEDLKHIEQMEFFEQKDFSKYVDYFYMIKCTAPKDSPEYIFAKLFLNSAYGKFAANPEKYSDTFLCDQADIGKVLAEGFSIHGEIHHRFIISKPNDPDTWRHYNIATGASITGFVRAYLLRAIESVENPIYCDTDSVIFTGRHSLSLSDDLGAWKVEGEFKRGGIGGKKIYALEDDLYRPLLAKAKTEKELKEANKHAKHACKGLRLDHDDVLKVCGGAVISKTPDNPIFSLKRGIYFQEKTIRMT